MKKSILINGLPFYYDAVDLKFAEGPQITFEQAKDVLFTMKQLLEEKCIRFWLIYGTLLGAIREKSFISHDFDVDIQTNDLDNLVKIIPWLDKHGMKLIRVDPGRVYTFSQGGVYIDVYIARRAPFPFNLWCYWLNGNIVPKKYITPLRQIVFLGGTFFIPGNAEDLLAFFYGKTWKTPIPGVHGRYDIYPVYFYRKYLKKLLGR